MAWGGLFPLRHIGEKFLKFGKGIEFRGKTNRDRREWIERELPLWGAVNSGSQIRLSIRTTLGVF